MEIKEDTNLDVSARIVMLNRAESFCLRRPEMNGINCGGGF